MFLPYLVNGSWQDMESLLSVLLHGHRLGTREGDLFFHLGLLLQSAFGGRADEAEEKDRCRNQLEKDYDGTDNQEDPESNTGPFRFDGPGKRRSRKQDGLQLKG